MASLVIYEYTAITAGHDYLNNPGYIYDLNDATYGAAASGLGAKIANLPTNQCVGTSLGTITKVEILAKSEQLNQADENNVKANYGGAGTYGDNHSIKTANGTPTEFAFDITADTNAPSPWTWADVQNLDLYFNGTLSQNALRLYYGKIRVTYTLPSLPSGGILNWFFSESWRKHDRIWQPKLILPKEGYSY